MSEQRKVLRAYADITIRVCRHDNESQPGVIYQERQMVPADYFSNTRYYGYVGFQFQEMYERMVATVKDHL